MKRHRIPYFFALIILFWSCNTFAKVMHVQVKQAELRPTPSFLSAPSAILNYGDSVEVLGEGRGWFNVSSPRGSGWLHNSALSTKKIALAGSDAQMNKGASTEELALAGKGFSKEVEAEFHKSNSKADFTAVDQMEKISISPKQKRDFIASGGLTIR